VLARTPLPGWPEGARVIAAAAGDVLGAKRGQFVVLARKGNEEGLYVWMPGAKVDTAWTLAASGKFLPASPDGAANAENVATSMTVADFWGTGRTPVVLRTGNGSHYCVPSLAMPRRRGFLQPSSAGPRSVEKPADPQASGVLVGCDFLETASRIRAIAGGRQDPNVVFRVAPRRRQRYKTVGWAR
jgi:hypothetical protein